MIRIKFEPRDLWIGIYWNIENEICEISNCSETYFYQRALKIYICILPMLPICLRFALKEGADAD